MDSRIGALWILNSTTGEILFSFEVRGHCIYSLAFVDNDRFIITSGSTTTGDPGPAMCWCAYTGRAVMGHWMESHFATELKTDASGSLIYIARFPDDPVDNTYDCVTADGDVGRSGNLAFSGISGFISESTKAFRDGSETYVAMLDLITGTVFELDVAVGSRSGVVGSSSSAVVNGAVKIIC
jgi:hypothetical protein